MHFFYCIISKKSDFDDLDQKGVLRATAFSQDFFACGETIRPSLPAVCSAYPNRADGF